MKHSIIPISHGDFKDFEKSLFTYRTDPGKKNRCSNPISLKRKKTFFYVIMFYSAFGRRRSKGEEGLIIE